MEYLIKHFVVLEFKIKHQDEKDSYTNPACNTNYQLCFNFK